jgi:hypothetical protein
VVTGSVVQLVGAVLMGLGCFLVWYKVAGVKVDPFDMADDDSVNGGVILFFAIVAAAFAVVGLLARRVLAVAIIAVVFAALGLLMVAGAISDGSDTKDLADLARLDFSWGPGLWIALVGSLVALAGSIVVLSKRRRWR